MIFEAVLALCLSDWPEICRDALIPHSAAPSQTACLARLSEAQRAAGARCQVAGPELAVTEIAPGVFVHVGAIQEPNRHNRADVANLGFVIGPEAVAVIDAGGAAWVGEALWRSIRARTDKPVSSLILTHMHPDHVFGATVFADAGVEIIGHRGLGRALAARAANYRESFAQLISPQAFLGSRVPQITRAVGSEVTLDLGGRRLILRAYPTAHTETDLTVYDVESGTLFAGDLVFDRHLPALDGALRGWQAVLHDLARTEVAQIVPGHGGPVLPWPDGLAPVERYLARLAHDTKQAIQRGERLGQAVEHVAASEAPHWQLFEQHNPRNATVAFTELEWE